MTYLTVPEVAATLRCSEDHVKTLCRRGDLGAAKVAGRWIIREEALDDYVQRVVEEGPQLRRRRRRRT